MMKLLSVLIVLVFYGIIFVNAGFITMEIVRYIPIQSSILITLLSIGIYVSMTCGLYYLFCLAIFMIKGVVRSICISVK